MRSYLDLIQKVQDIGQWKENRTGTKCLTVPPTHWEHDMSKGFPLLTTKKMAFKTISVELEGFINGITSKKWYQDRGCKIWDAWANPRVVCKKAQEVFGYDDTMSPEDAVEYWNSIKEHTQRQEDDLGVIYGFQWRRFGEAYDEDDGGVLKGADQLKSIIDTLETDPNDRRMVCSAWNPNQLDRMALPPCHLLFIITHINGVVNLHWTQRSCDLFLGVPFNIASYALLLELICSSTGLKAGQLSATFCDLHIYEDHLEQVKQQYGRPPLALSTINLKQSDIFKWTHEDVELLKYKSYDRISAPVAV